jgi:16S rRNA (guanine527-N7)-methyltransferase
MTVPALKDLLREARDRGYLGDQSAERQIQHARGFGEVCAAVGAVQSPASRDTAQADEGEPTQLLDLGAGAGLPGLVLALNPVPSIDRVVLLDGSVRRAEWLREAVESLELAASVVVVGERAEVAGRMLSWRGHFSIVVARSFGRPAVTAECAAPFLHVGGFLIVSEPPSGEEALPPGSNADLTTHSVARSSELEHRWPPEHVAELGFGPAVEWRASGYRYAALRLESPCPDRYPRRNGIPAKRSLF